MAKVRFIIVMIMELLQKKIIMLLAETLQIARNLNGAIFFMALYGCEIVYSHRKLIFLSPRCCFKNFFF